MDEKLIYNVNVVAQDVLLNPDRNPSAAFR